MSKTSTNTQIDDIIASLALSRSICYVKQRRKICKPEYCEYCDIFNKQNEVYSSLPSDAQLATNNIVNFKAEELLRRTPALKPWQENLVGIGKVAVIFSLICLVWIILI